MPLGEKVKQIFHSDGTTHDSSEDITRHTPGSFPTDDMNPRDSQTIQSTTGARHEHNKLHKENDPRGFTGHDTSSGSQQYQDSGAGLTQHRDPTSHQSQQSQQYAQQGTTGAFDDSQRQDPTSQQSTQQGTTGGFSDTLTDRSKDSTKPTSQGVGNTSSAPYWGDLPSGGAHSTDAGQSIANPPPQLETQVHTSSANPGTSSTGPDNRTIPGSQGTHQSSGSALPRQGDSSFQPADSYSPQGQHPLSQTQNTSTHGSTLDNPQDRSSGSRFSEGAATTGAVGAAAGAYGLNKAHRDDERSAEKDRLTGAGTSTGTGAGTDHDSKHHDESKGRSFPLLGRSHKDDTHHHKETKEEKHVKEEKHKEPKHEGGSKLGGLFHRSGNKDTLDQETTRDINKDKRDNSNTTPLVAAGVGGAATYAATRAWDNDKEREHTGRHQDTTASRGTDQYSGTGQQSGLGQHSGIGQSGTGQHSGIGQHSGTSQFSSAGQRSDLDTARGFDSHTDRTGRDPTTQSHQQRNPDHSGLAAGVLAGSAATAAAGAASGRSDHSGQHPIYDQYASTGQQQSTTGQDSGLGASNRAYGSESAGYHSGGSTGQHFQQHDSHENASKYGVGDVSGLPAGPLASHSGHDGRDTGVGQQSRLDSDRGYNTQGSQPTERSYPDEQSHQQGSNRNAYLATGAAAGLGAGVLASRSGHDDRSGHDTRTGQYGDSDRSYNTQSQGLSSTNDPSYQSRQQRSHDNSHLASGTAAGLGAGALASRSGHDDRTGNDGRTAHLGESDRSYNTQSQGLSGTQGQGLSNFNDPSSQSHQQGYNKNAYLATGAAAGLGAGALASRSGHDSNSGQQHSGLESDRNFNNQGQYPTSTGNSGQIPQQQGYSTTTTTTTGPSSGFGGGALGSQSAHDSRSGQPHSGQEPGKNYTAQSQVPTGSSAFTEQSSQQPRSHKDAYIGTGVAAGLGAGAYAANQAGDRHGDQTQTQTTSGRSEGYQPGSSTTQTTTGTTTTSSHDRDVNDPTPRSHNETIQSGDQSAPSRTGDTEEVKYDTLASGTPSGIIRSHH